MQSRLLVILWITVLFVILVTAPTRSVAIVRYGAFLNGNYVDGTTQTVYAGQQLNFSDHYQTHIVPVIPGSPTSTTVTVSWEIDGHPIKSYVIGNDSATVTYLSAADLSQQTLTCYLLASGPATATCRVIESAYTGQTWYSTGSCGINILKPARTPIPTTGQVVYTNNGISALLSFGTPTGSPGSPGIAPGIYIAQGGTGVTGAPNQVYCTCPLLHTYDTYFDNIHSGHNSVDPTLDGSFPYGAYNQPFEDSPKSGVTTVGGADPELSVSINATAYLMWNCGISGAIWAPINSVDWNGSAEEIDGLVTVASQRPTVTNTQSDLTTPPTWNNTYTH